MIISEKDQVLLQKKKGELRNKISVLRKDMTDDEYNMKSMRLCEHLWLDPIFHKAKTIMVFAPHNKEPNILPVIQRCLTKKIVCFPRVSGNSLHPYSITSFDELSPGAFGILEPRVTNKINPKTIDLVLLPALAIDDTGNRLGYGGGFYDRFLSQYKIPTLGIVFDFQRMAILPAGAYDIPAKSVVTEWGVSIFS